MSEHTQNFFWEPAWYIQGVHSVPFDLDQPSPHENSYFMSMTEDPKISAWNIPVLDESLSESSTPRAEIEQYIEANILNHNSRRHDSRKSMDAKKKRREQNRISQMAHRQRSKKQLEYFRNRLEECTEYNHAMYRTLQALGEKTQALACEIKHALSLQPPQRELEQYRSGSEEFQWPPWSRDGSPMLRRTGKEVVPLIRQPELPWSSGRIE
ncbi:hypothetical protein F5882DRAFT_445771 [Hyaloscypha sp. PMI_1271]|nr:hypothetical protein F5882DRAFT_445771 [Hyaloscypha sp. PMI_1271]